MNPLVEKMLEKTVSNDTETRLLEDLFEQNCECQSKHMKVPTCAGIASYRVTSCSRDTLQCADAIEHPVQGLLARRERNTCRDCDQEAWVCWTIRPI